MSNIVSKNIRVRCPDDFIIGDNSIVDDFSYFSTKVKIGRCSHVASGCSIAGGKDSQFELGDYSSISSGVKIWCVSNDFSNDVVTIIPPEVLKISGNIKGSLIKGDVKIGNFTAVGSNTVIMPDNYIPEGTVVGAISFVPSGYKFKSWSVYAGIPVRFVKKRNRRNVLRQVELIEKYLKK